MANKTVYPYGTAGSLPSSIGIVNDFTTGGADKALSAEAGKNFYEEVFGSNDPVDLSILPEETGIIAENNSQEPVWSLSGGTCCFLPVNPGQEYTITANANYNTNYAFLKQSGVGEEYSTPDFASGYSGRITLLSGASAVVIAPVDALVLYIRKTSSNGGNMLPSVSTGVDGLEKRIEAELDNLEVDVNIISIEDAQSYNIAIGPTQNWQTGIGKCILIPICAGWKYKIVSNENYNTHLAILAQSIPGGNNESVSFATGFTDRVIVEAGGNSYTFVAPNDAVCLYLRLTDSNSNDMKPEAVYADNDGDRLLKGTFQGAYNETDTESIREKVGGIINGKGNIETFLFFTDPHLTPNSRYESMNEFLRDKYISVLQKFYKSLPLDSCICGGDWLNFDHTNAEAAGWLGYCDGYMRKLFRNYLPVFGNHDNNPYNPDTSRSNWTKALTYVDIRNLMFRENKLTYYSHEAVNTRFYVLNSGVSFIKEMTNSSYSRLVNNRWPQVDWLGQKLLSEDPAHGVIVLHIYSNAENESEWFSTATGYWAKGIHAFGANVKAMAIAYNNRQSITLNGITYDFSDCDGNIAFIMCGHTHFDYVDTSGELPIVCCTNLEGGYLDSGSIKYTLTPTFDNCVVDYDSGVLYMVRVGAAKSRIVHFVPQSLSAGSTLELDTELTGTVTWASRDTAKATVSNGTVTGVASGIVGVKASDDTTEEYWIIKVS